MNNTKKSEMVKEKKDVSSSNTTKTLWVGDLDKIKDEVVDENYILHRMFYEFAEDIIKVKLCKEKNSQRHSYAFIEFTNYDMAKYCFDNLNGKWIPGRIHRFKLNWAKYNITENVNTHEKNLDVELDDKGTYSIYVGGLPKGTTKEEIETLFSQFYSSICFVKMIKNVQKNQNTIYCFIHFFNYDECIKALKEMDGYDFRGCKIKVSTSKGVKVNKGGIGANNYYYKNNNYQMNMNSLKGVNMGSYHVDAYGGNYAHGGYTHGNYSQGSYNQAGYPTGNYSQANHHHNSLNSSSNDCANSSSKVENNQTNEEENKNVPEAGVAAPGGVPTGEDPNKNYYMYYQNVNSEMNNPYKLNYYDHISSNVTSYPAYSNTGNHGTPSLSFNSNGYGSEMNYYSGQITQIAQMNNYGNDINHTGNFQGSNGHVNNYTSEFNCVTNYNLTPGKEDEQNHLNYRMGNVNYSSAVNSEDAEDSLKNMKHEKKEGNGNLKNEEMSTEDNIINHMTKKNGMMEGNLNSMNHHYGLNFYNRPCSNNEYSNNCFNPMGLHKTNANGEINYNGSSMGSCHMNDMSSANNYYYNGEAQNLEGRSNQGKNNSRNHSNTNNSTNNGSVDNNETIDNEQSVRKNDFIDNDHSEGMNGNNVEDNK
ncbi:RNA-binding protein, putative [Plasmodium knowlesi strain H]|uniref:RNA-binding protein, putative n=3 Tax=Plasmodium knowlesi TaxID=5850 RepID=A0A5K1U7P9_PLAKH|nr:polyadenylate-binding protein 3, putative [Plasmodium knowlesi strain H]OTN64380.1 putative RNA binding protein [Plasmodium knowlesi]CAA9989029.1 polyadenylate-binding protein 3, putative [Plasmodium knowlesi strain H]SBO24873.1 RNA-binding protein, putative [Plasmodium knowlesi strain H]SBO27547.1 RNA-binding protein, putative [Plasmodium knowlesi strain H]VVS78503.1 polyadenylate-binding protein 3, putative [Plasmodium knowlesi strain H]|eukprot:XP_002261377.1 RNA binding protein, putative [Plasmodium knowlesi strain H]